MDKRDDTIRMAREAGAAVVAHDEPAADLCCWMISTVELEQFAELVRADEREACAKLCKAERDEFMEQAARNDGRHSDMAFGSVNSAERIAAAIRARGAT